MSICRLDAYVDADEINAFRKLSGLSPIVTKNVDCLRCGRKFMSKDYPRIRMCRRCRVVDISASLYGYDPKGV